MNETWKSNRSFVLAAIAARAIELGQPELSFEQARQGVKSCLRPDYWQNSKFASATSQIPSTEKESLIGTPGRVNLFIRQLWYEDKFQVTWATDGHAFAQKIRFSEDVLREVVSAHAGEWVRELKKRLQNEPKLSRAIVPSGLLPPSWESSVPLGYLFTLHQPELRAKLDGDRLVLVSSP